MDQIEINGVSGHLCNKAAKKPWSLQNYIAINSNIKLKYIAIYDNIKS